MVVGYARYAAKSKSLEDTYLWFQVVMKDLDKVKVNFVTRESGEEEDDDENQKQIKRGLKLLTKAFWKKFYFKPIDKSSDGKKKDSEQRGLIDALNMSLWFEYEHVALKIMKLMGTPTSIPALNSSSSIHADYVPAGHVLISADRYRIC
ncbi:hypothetical protein Tco_0968284 [Tanacetum coccineum]